MEERKWYRDDEAPNEGTAEVAPATRLNANAYKTKYADLNDTHAVLQAEAKRLADVVRYQELAIQAQQQTITALQQTILALRGPAYPGGE